MNSNGDPQIRKIGKDFYINVEDVVAIIDFFSEEALDQLMDIDEDETTEFDMGMFEGIAEVLDDFSKSLRVMVTEKRLNKIKTLEDFNNEFPATPFNRNRKIKQ